MATSEPPGNPLERTYELPAGAERVFAALTDAPQLRAWFAEHAQVEPRAGGAYRFWGKFTAWIPSEAVSDGRILEFESGRRLSYAFTWRETRCEVALAIEAIGAGKCLLHVRMSAAPRCMGLGKDCPWYMLDFWRYSIGNLRHYLKTGVAALRPDFTARGPVDLSIFIAAPPERVFAALTDPEKMDRWLSKKATVELRKGGAYSFGWTQKGAEEQLVPCGPGRILEVVPGKLVVHDWTYQGEPPTTVRWELTAAPGGTMVHLTHDVPPSEPVRAGYVGGWSSYLVELAEFAQMQE